MNKYNLINTTLTFQAIRSKLTGNIIWSTIVNKLDCNIMLDSKDFKEDIFKEFKRLFVTFYNSDYLISLEEILYEDKYKDLIEIISGSIQINSPLSIEQQIERIILIHDDKYTNSLNIRIGDVLNHYDDGKIKTSRQSQVIITKIVKYEDIDEETKLLFEQTLEDDFDSRFYVSNPSYFIFAKSIDYDDKIYIYVPRKEDNDSWFSFNQIITNGELDITGELTALIQ